MPETKTTGLNAKVSIQNGPEQEKNYQYIHDGVVIIETSNKMLGVKVPHPETGEMFLLDDESKYKPIKSNAKNNG